MQLNKQLAFRMESCFKETHLAMAKQHPHGRVLEIAGGAACFAGEESFFSQVISWGFATSTKHLGSQIEAIERFYHSLGHARVDIELCPLVGNEIALFLGRRGYQLTELSNVSFLDLSTYKSIDLTANEPTRTLEETELDDWAKIVALAFGYPEAKAQFADYIRLKGVTVFAVDVDGGMVSGGTIAVHGSIADFAVTSTALAYRGRGLQKHLLQTRLNVAKQQGLELAMVTTEPGSISDLNVQKVGFHCAYTRVKLTREL
jgi:GNAT superfamily N-acetyltransferase